MGTFFPYGGRKYQHFLVLEQYLQYLKRKRRDRELSTSPFPLHCVRGNQTKTLKLVKFQELPPFTSFPHMSSPLILLLPPAHANHAHFKKNPGIHQSKSYSLELGVSSFFDIKRLGEFFSADPITRAFFSCGISRKERGRGALCVRRKKGIKCGKPEEGKQIIPPEKAGGGRGCRIYWTCEVRACESVCGALEIPASNRSDATRVFAYKK